LSIDHNQAVLDVELLNDYLERLGIDIIKKMYVLYHQQATIYLDDIQRALSIKDNGLWQEHCHKMKGAASSVGLKSLYSMLAIMEKTNESMDKREEMLEKLKIKNKKDSLTFQAWVEQH